MRKSKIKKKINCVNENSDESENEDIASVDHVFPLTNSDFNSTEILTDGKPIKVLIDSGASVNCMDKNTSNSVITKSTKLEKSNAKIYPFASKIPLKLLGVSSLNVVVNGKLHKFFT